MTDKLRNLNHDIESSDLESDSDLDSIRNSCDVFTAQTAHCALKPQFLFDGSLNLGRNHCIFFISDDMEMFHECTREEKEHPSKTPKKTKMESKKQMLGI